ncbi:MAG TPA: SHOCT domain-containing protein [Promineifilum sp.]|nr:SHOCT domain-containing protein [Promineifilum sp.]HRO88943.1 SHOCT domain-containing protein [Promineifilum sp.]HRQ13811.1 SHOCT domain-containing protein [Promineifilum sp.]
MRRRSNIRSTRRTVRRMHRRRVRMRRRRILLTGGLVAIAVAGTASAVKMSQRDAQRIEAHTGKKPEDLTEEQLEAAINDLEIDTQELTDADVAAIEAAGPEPAAESASAAPPPAAPAAPAPPAAAPAAPAAPAQPDYITELKRLAELRDMGIITAEDFETKKNQLLGL